jgi:ribosome-associated heat shock protein Hsp15
VGEDSDAVRVDRWLWAVRLYRTRSAAADACRGGHVRVNGRGVKAARLVRTGDRVEARVGPRRRVLEVVRPIDKRVGAAVAAEAYVDHSPPPEPRVGAERPAVTRERGSGRPTKRERRQTDRLRRRR